MAENMIETIGDRERLCFELSWPDGCSGGTAAERTWGELTVFVNDRLLWGRRLDEGTRGFEWTWVELLEHLADNWLSLLVQEGDPLGLSGLPHEIRTQAEVRWRDVPEELRRAEEEQLWDWEQVHNLAAAVQGAWPPALWLVREGRIFFVAGAVSSTRSTWTECSAQEIEHILTRLGDCIAGRLAPGADPRSADAVRAWKERTRKPPADELVGMATYLSAEQVREIDLDEGWELSDAFEPNELLAVARKSHTVLDSTEIRNVLDEVRAIRKRDTNSLEGYSRAALEQLARNSGCRPHDQGYTLALWLRDYASLGNACVSPETLLAELGVLIRDIRIGNSAVDAVCVWGPRHGPAILCNKDGLHMSSAQGRRTTLAHEICHLLVDRDSALPLAEVLGGSMPAQVEARAKAFAAELLLPRDVAVQRLREASSIGEFLNRITNEYQVSAEVAAWQVRNSGTQLTRDEARLLRAQVSSPHHF